MNRRFSFSLQCIGHGAVVIQFPTGTWRMPKQALEDIFKKILNLKTGKFH